MEKSEKYKCDEVRPRYRHHNRTKIYTSEDLSLYKTYLKYDELTGVFSWAKPPGKSVKVNKKPGTLRPDGYLRIHLKGKSHLAHRLAYCFMNGPTLLDIDHIDGNRLNNSIKNLRAVTYSINQHNRKTKIKIYFDKKCRLRPYTARFNYNRKPYYLGQFADEQSAINAIMEKKKQMGISI